MSEKGVEKIKDLHSQWKEECGLLRLILKHTSGTIENDSIWK